MLIRCDKCSTLYELEEDLLPPRGAPVQCSKCQFVFTAYPAPRTEPPRGSSEVDEKGERLRQAGGYEAARSQLSASGASSPDSFPLREEMETESDYSAPASTEPQFTADGRPIRKVPFPKVEDPVPAGQRPGTARTPGRVSAPPGFSWQKAQPWIVLLAIVAVFVIALVAWRMLGHRVDPAVAQRREGQSSVLPDDRTERAPAAAVDDGARLDGGSLEPVAPGPAPVPKKRAR